jgi:hypothetical protein
MRGCAVAGIHFLYFPGFRSNWKYPSPEEARPGYIPRWHLYQPRLLFFRDGQDISVLFLEGAEFACPDTHIREINIPVNYVGYVIPDCFFAKLVRKGK